MDKQPNSAPRDDQTERLDEPKAPEAGIVDTVVQRRFTAPVPGDDFVPNVNSNSNPYPFLSPPLASDELGRLGDYRILKLLGEGGMGFVFRGEDPILQRDVALKVMRPEAAAKPQAAERFLREGRAAAGLKSDHIITIYQVGQANGVPFIAMEFLNGLPVDVWFRKQTPPIPLTHVLRIVRDTLRGLATAHEKGLIHRDIKPANLWLEKETSRVKVLDFGLTRSQDSSDQVTADGAVVGTPAYMAPEQAGGKAVDLRADLFSVGTVMYQLLAGVNPFVREHTMGTLGAVMYEKQPPLASVRADVPLEYSDFVDRLLAKDPNQRPANAKVALAELTAIEKKLREGTPTAMLPAPEVVPLASPVVVPVPAEAEVWRDLTTNEDTHVESTPAKRPVERRKPSRAPMFIVAGTLAGLIVFIIVGLVMIVLNKDGIKPKTEPVEEPLAENKETGKTNSGPTPKKDPKDAVAQTPDRRAAEYVLSVGGHLRINGSNNAGEAIHHPAQLPKEPFRLTAVSLSTKAVTNQGLANFKGTQHLQEITLRELPNITAEGLVHFQENKELTTIDFWASTSIDEAVIACFRNCKSLVGVNLGECRKITNNAVAHLQGCRSLKYLNLSECSLITNECLAIFGDCPELVELNLDNCVNITDEGLAVFSKCPRIASVRLIGTKVTNDYLRAFQKSSTLHTLTLARTNITDEGLAHLKDCERLQLLDLYGTKTNDTTLALLAQFPHLLQLNLGNTKITNQGLQAFKQHKRLNFLGLQYTDITDEGLTTLLDIPNLTGLELNGTKVREKAIQDFHANKPACRVSWDNGVLEPRQPNP